MGGASGAPAGAYTAVFAGVEPKEATGEMGPGYTWRWRIATGAHTGKSVQRITGQSPSPSNACGRILSAIAGKTLGEGEDFRLEDYIGKSYMVVVQATPSGGTRVETAVIQG